MSSEPSRASGASLSAEDIYDQVRTAKSSRRKPTPFDRHWDERDAAPDKRFVVDSNAFERALLKYVALLEGKAVHVLARELLREAALRRVMDL